MKRGFFFSFFLPLAFLVETAKILNLVRELRLDLLLETAQKEGAQDAVELEDRELHFLLIKLHDLLICSSKRCVEPLCVGSGDEEMLG